MRKLFNISCIFLFGYLVLWSVIYFWIMGLDVLHFFDYFLLSWGGAGEIPAFIQWGAISGAILIALIYVAINGVSKRGNVG